MDRGVNSLTKQVGGAHYMRYPYQPVEFFMRSGLNYASANIIKYTLRHREKNGVEDLRKALHYCTIAIDMPRLMAEASDGQLAECERFIERNALGDLVAEIVEYAVQGYYLSAIEALCVLAHEEYGEDIGRGIIG